MAMPQKFRVRIDLKAALLGGRQRKLPAPKGRRHSHYVTISQQGMRMKLLLYCGHPFNLGDATESGKFMKTDFPQESAKGIVNTAASFSVYP